MPAAGLPLARLHANSRFLQSTAQAEARTSARPALHTLNPSQKAAIVVRYILSEGGELQINQLPESLQAILAEQMGALRLVDKETLSAVIDEFTNELEGVGLAFPGGLEGALNAMEGHLSHNIASRLRRKAGMTKSGDPWERLAYVGVDQLYPLVEAESIEIASVIVSKLPVAKAAEILGRIAGERARRIAFGVSRTSNIDPDAVHRIGMAVLGQIDAQPLKAFERGPVERVGAILNVTPSMTRDHLLEGLETQDAHFADRVRRAIFTYAHIPVRISARDVPKIIRLVDQGSLVTAMTYSKGKPDLEPASEFLLASISQRMAQNIKDEIETRGRVKDKEAETAFGVIIGAIRQLEALGELVLLHQDDE